MKRLIVTIMLVLLTATPVFAVSDDGFALAKNWHEYKKFYDGFDTRTTIIKIDKVGEYMGFVKGVVDALDGRAFAIPNNVMRGDVYAIVGKYLDDHPKELKESAVYLVIKALSIAFPQK
jgi:hypothetical protein